MGKSVNRVKQAALDAGMQIDVITLASSARTAQDAADSLGCALGQIVKSLLFEGADTGALKLVLVSGAHPLDQRHAASLFGEPLIRADPKRVRAETGFAIGGVAPIGHLCGVETFMDAALMQYASVWAAAGAPETVFEIRPAALLAATQARLFTNG
jgi:prolyl-tRNA editing enzyme YbaK/EbsC (Cys-tRNA(Pro) deacylase)